MNLSNFRPLGVVVLAIAFLSQIASAGVFNIPHFTAPGEFAVGVEPDLRLSQGAGLGMNLKYTQGLNDLMNAQGIVGVGGGSHGFRIGGNTSFDFFPDTEGQPGIGIATQAIYYHLDTGGDIELTGIPYVHKTFVSSGNEIDPFLALPIGWDFTSGSYQGKSTLAVGAIFKNNDHIRYVTEFGISINHSQTYVSGGVVYQH